MNPPRKTVRTDRRRWATAAPALLAALIAFSLASRRAVAQADRIVEHDLGQKEKSYRVILPADVKPKEKLHLVVYLHPSGNANFDQVQRDYWPLFRPYRFLMLMPRSRGKRMWIAGEEHFVVSCMQHVRGRYPIVPGSTVLLGVSAGGQVALLLADRLPAIFRAVIVVSTNPVVARSGRAEWFYPNRKVLKTCPYFVINHIMQGSALMYWRQVRAKLQPKGASISIRPVLGKDDHYLPPPKELKPWLATVMAGKQPKPLPDLQKQAVAAMFAKAVAALKGALTGAPLPSTVGTITKAGQHYDLTVPLPEDYQRSAREDSADSTGAPLNQVRFEHKKWPIYVRVEASVTAKPMRGVLAAEEAETEARGMLYQVYQAARVPVGGRFWQVKVGSITYPDMRKDASGKPRGWVSVLFVHASAPVQRDPRRWLTVMVMDETGKPQASELAGLFRLAATRLTVQPGTAKPKPKPKPKPPAKKKRG